MISGIFFILSAVSTVLAQVVDPSKPCLPENRIQNESACLRRITDAIFNDTEFFFGKNLDGTCTNTAQNNPDDLNCYIGDESMRQYTIASRLFNGRIKPETIDRFLQVTFETGQGSYNACGSHHSIDTRITDVNPDMIPAKPVEVRLKPKFDMKVEPNTFYSIVIVDLGFKFFHGLIVDYPESEVKIEYKSPLNFRNVTNAFAFIVYKQPTKGHFWEPRVIMRMQTNRDIRDFPVNYFASEHGLTGPVALNWMLVSNDPWAVEQVAIAEKDANYCLIYHQDAFRLSSLEFMDKNFSTIDSTMNVTFISPPMSFSSCCSAHSLGLMQVELNPVIGQASDLVFLRNQPAVQTEKTVFRSTVNDRMYTILAVDPNLSDKSLGLPSQPYLNWLAVDVSESSMKSGLIPASLFPYVQPIPQLQSEPRRIYFLLLEQSASTVSLAGILNQTSSSICGLPHTGRCLFDVRRFIEENRLVLRGFSWINVTTDAYSRMKLVESGARTDEVCQNVAEYKPGCSTQGSLPKTNVISPRQSGNSLLAGVSILLFSVLISVCSRS